jgi:hypothetical protein
VRAVNNRLTILRARAYITKGMYMFVARDKTTSIHHRVHANIAAPWPHAGTHTKQIMLIIVARPIGKVPR